MHGRGACVAGGVCGRGACMAGGMCGRRGACMVGGVRDRGRGERRACQILRDTVNERVVRILLEYILVVSNMSLLFIILLQHLSKQQQQV